MLKEEVVRSLYYSKDETEKTPISLTTKLETGTYALEYNILNRAPETINPSRRIRNHKYTGCFEYFNKSGFKSVIMYVRRRRM